MAAVAVSPAQYQIGIMASRRAPLSSVPNAVNSPYRVPLAAPKRSRQQADQEDVLDDQQPLAKRIATSNGRLYPRTPPQKQSLQQAEARVFGKRPGNAPPTAFERKLLAAKENKALEAQAASQERRLEKPTRVAAESLEGIRQWQKHYRRVFPTFVFYFESVSDDTRARHSKFIRAFGAREEKFFSREVTHIITSRSLPGDNDVKPPTDTLGPSSIGSSAQQASQPRTINPTLLDRNLEAQRQVQDAQSKPKFDFGTAIGRKVHAANIRELEPKKTVDILQRARDMGIKIWPLEKLERIAKTMLDNRADEPSLRGSGGRGVALNAPLPTKAKQEPALSHLLRKEQLNGLSDAANATGGIISFKGPHIYVRCIDEKTKPILVKEWPKVARREDGQWPQFRGNSVGKCPFIVDPSSQRQEVERPKAKVQQTQAQQVEEIRHTRQGRQATGAATTVSRQLDNPVARRQPLAESREGGNVMVSTKTRATGQENSQAPPETRPQPPSPIKAASNIPAATRLRFFNGEPAASGMQPSNITSAIRSQMISSTAAQPGAKAGTSREVHGLQRKVLEKNTSTGLQATQAGQKSIDPLGAARAERHIPLVRQTRRQPQERLIHIDEESTQSEDEEDAWQQEAVQKGQVLVDQARKREPKTGYCENCRESYVNFDEHILDRKHRKFALTQDNWKELDRLLAVLGRPLKEGFSDSF
ncbi:MAG: hypothetical protein L6R39_004692 [Caloplaca ligustica]|nr:MAG: hypothetical protein L6R39_004692 [Caloplaca ligustica]